MAMATSNVIDNSATIDPNVKMTDMKAEADITSRPSSRGEMGIGEVKSVPKWKSWARMLSIEVGGIQRVTEEERRENTTHVWNACTFW